MDSINYTILCNSIYHGIGIIVIEKLHSELKSETELRMLALLKFLPTNKRNGILYSFNDDSIEIAFREKYLYSVINNWFNYNVNQELIRIDALFAKTPNTQKIFPHDYESSQQYMIDDYIKLNLCFYHMDLVSSIMRIVNNEDMDRIFSKHIDIAKRIKIQEINIDN